MVILAIMTQRILYLLDTNAQINLQWEVAVYTCFLGLMLYAPFNPWQFDPGYAFEQIVGAGKALAGIAGGAVAGAAQAAGVPQSTIKAAGQAYNKAMGGFEPFLENQEQGMYGIVNPYNPLQAKPVPGFGEGGGEDGHGHGGGGGGITPGASGGGAPATMGGGGTIPTVTGATMNATVPDHPLPPGAGAPSGGSPGAAPNDQTTSASAPPSSSNNENASNNGPTIGPSAPPDNGQPSVTANPHASAADVNAGKQQQMADAGVPSTGDNLPPSGAPLSATTSDAATSGNAQSESPPHNGLHRLPGADASEAAADQQILAKNAAWTPTPAANTPAPTDTNVVSTQQSGLGANYLNAENQVVAQTRAVQRPDNTSASESANADPPSPPQTPPPSSG